MLLIWNILYWGNITCGTVLNRFFQRYWRTGNFTVTKRICEALRYLTVDIIAIVAILGLAILVCTFLFGIKGMPIFKSAVLMLNHVYGMLILTWLLGYGMFHLPLHFFSKSYLSYYFYKNVAKAAGIYRAYRNSQIELYRHCNACRNAVAMIRREGAFEKLATQIKILEDSIPEKYDDGIEIKGNRHIQEFVMNPNMSINERTLGRCRFKLVVAYYQYKRKKARWVANTYRVISAMLPLGKLHTINPFR